MILASDSVRRSLGGVLAVISLCAWTAWSTPPAFADHEPDHQPAARLEIVIKKFFIFSDKDWFGEGEMRFYVVVSGPIEGCPDHCGKLVSSLIKFGADTGEWVDINRAVPGAADYVPDSSIGPGIGIPVYPGESYILSIHGREEDPFLEDFMGGLGKGLNQGNGWGIGTHEENGNSFSETTFTVDYEIRRVPLPDLVAHNLIPFTASNGRIGVRMIMQNVGERDAGPFQLALRMDGADSPVASYDFPGLAAGTTADAFYFPTSLPTGEHLYTFSIDDPRAMPEMDETNNQIAERFALQPATVAGPQGLVGPGEGRTGPDAPASSSALVDLTVSAIRVNGEAASENNCETGKNDVAVMIKNLGTAAATNFVLRLVIDDEADEGTEKPVASLPGNQELSVTFDDVHLKKGEHRLTATADVRKTVTEAKDDNNELKTNLKCKDDD